MVTHMVTHNMHTRMHADARTRNMRTNPPMHAQKKKAEAAEPVNGAPSAEKEKKKKKKKKADE